MATITSIEYSHTFREQLYSRFSYLSRHLGEQASQDLLADFLELFEARVQTHPASVPVCLETADIGLTANHDCIDSKLQLRVVYRVSDTADIVFALLFLNTRLLSDNYLGRVTLYILDTVFVRR
ncbi:MAG TPA: hypothetical protein VL020_05230 [Pseudomonadales bacterium]|nr:hypothetical protein [Pseudomonadales bacterium]